MKRNLMFVVVAAVSAVGGANVVKASSLNDTLTYEGVTFSYGTYADNANPNNTSLNSNVTTSGAINFVSLDVTTTMIFVDFDIEPLTPSTASPLSNSLSINDNASGVFIGEDTGMYNYVDVNGQVNNNAYAGISLDGFTVTNASGTVYPENDGSVYFDVTWYGSWGSPDGGIIAKGLSPMTVSAPSIASTPEPTSLAFLGVSGLMLLRRRSFR